MNESPERRLLISDHLLAWTEGGIVLFAQFAEERWQLARGWRRADCLTDIRLWSFDCPERFAGQVRRLVYEIAGESGVAERMSAVAGDWARDFVNRQIESN
jgi:hypothetical protein